MSEKTLGLITIGQTPRPDLEAEFRRFAPDATISMMGALDGLNETDLHRLSTGPRSYPLLTRLADGSTLVIERSRLLPLVQAAVSRMAEAEPAVMVLLCAGDLPALDASRPLLIPGILLPGVVRACARTSTIGIVTPVEGQVDAARAKWRADGFSPQVTWASPFDPAEIDRAVADLNDPRLELIVLDCMGHDPDYRRRFGELSGLPVLAAQTVVARIAAELLES